MKRVSLLERAWGDLRSATLLINQGGDECLIDNAAYFTQQAVEKALKYVLHKRHVPVLEVKTHNILILCDKVDNLGLVDATGNKIIVSQDIRNAGRLLTQWESRTRYASSYWANVVDVNRCIGLAKSFLCDIGNLELQKII